MKLLRFVFIGILFGVVMTKSEVVSWYRIQEMFRFQSFHMYGVIGAAVVTGVLVVALIKRFKLKDLDGNPIVFSPKAPTVWRYLLGGTLFGLGWALSGACPGPLYTLLGHGYVAVLVVIAGALAGTLAYGLLRSKLPH